MYWRTLLSLAATCTLGIATPAAASCAQISQVGSAAAQQHRARLAGYYDHKLALLNGRVYEWRDPKKPRLVLRAASHVAVSKTHGYAIDERQRALTWPLGSTRIEPLLDDVVLISAGDSGLLAIRCDGSLWQRRAGEAQWSRSADAAIHAWIGDGADYYIAPGGRLYARGLAHRGQYGDGQLAERPGWAAVAEQASEVVGHTGHALYRRADGAVLGTGGNRYGPLGSHGLGDKADRWGVIFEGAAAIAIGSRHSLALRPDGSLYIWGGVEGVQPRLAMQDVEHVAAGLEETIAIDRQGRLWNWPVGQRPSAAMQLPALD
jgi:alpha-tubulin suppressor-like RCC1 family protein